MLETLNKYLEDGLVQNQVHPSLPLTIWNYTPKTQYGELYNMYKLWDDITLQCRGLVTDNEGNVIARPFRKFFNMEEKQHTPTDDFEVFEKMDGSLGIMFKYNGEMICATRGSFTSDQALWMTEFAKEHGYDKTIVEGFTYLFEIIYPENRIVVDYGDSKRLVLLGIIKTESGEEIPYDEIEMDGWDIVQRFDKFTELTYLKNAIPDNKEGYVIRFSNGSRMKIKGEEYLRLHKIMTNLSTTSVWEVLSTGGKMEDYLENVPDEFYNKIKEYEKSLRYAFYQVSEHCGKAHDYFRYGKYGDVDPEPTKKQFAEHVMKYGHPPYRGVMFAMWDRKPYDQLIWKLLKPKFMKL
jgi:RNA ligase